MQIKDTDLVLEVGSGNRPYARSNILLDKFLDNSDEREGKKPIVIDRPFVIADVEYLPFPDKRFDYIISSHILEHVYDPAKFLNELMRVGKRGYIETPFYLEERLYDWPFHRWYVFWKGNTLVLVRKTKKHEQFFFAMRDKRRRQLLAEISKEVHVLLSFEWEGKITYEVLQKEPPHFFEDLDKKLSEMLEMSLVRQSSNSLSKSGLDLSLLYSLSSNIKNTLYKYIVFLKNAYIAKQRSYIDLYSLIVCPACKKTLLLKESNLLCTGCKRNYRIEQGTIPVLLE